MSPDGLILAYTAGAEEGEEVWTVPLSGGEVEDLMEPPFRAGRFHPDGSWIAFSRGGWKGEVWLMGDR